MLIAPKEGAGLHQWLLTFSRGLLVDGYKPNDVVEMLLEAARSSNRTTQDIEEEIQNAVDGAVEFLRDNPSFVSRPNKTDKTWIDPLSFSGLDDSMSRHDRRSARLPVDAEKQRIAIRTRTLELDRESACKKFNFWKLFAGIDFNICATIKQSSIPNIWPLSKWVESRELYKQQFIVPNYFRDSCARWDFNIGERLFLVVEFDSSPSVQIAYLDYLDRTNPKFPLVMIVFSGNESAHGWFCCYGQSEYSVKTFCRRATELGADRTTYSPSQYVRMPLGRNYKTGEQQEIWYLDDEQLSAQAEIVRREML